MDVETARYVLSALIQAVATILGLVLVMYALIRGSLRKSSDDSLDKFTLKAYRRQLRMLWIVACFSLLTIYFGIISFFSFDEFCGASECWIAFSDYMVYMVVAFALVVFFTLIPLILVYVGSEIDWVKRKQKGPEKEVNGGLDTPLEEERLISEDDLIKAGEDI